ncbi:MAG: hypothetical protein ACJAUW_000003 [Yoonia sp.]|jgi:hypothetical protein
MLRRQTIVVANAKNDALAKEKNPRSALSRNPLVGPARSERVVWIWHLFSDFNGCFGDARCIAARNLLQLRTNAASAKPEK